MKIIHAIENWTLRKVVCGLLPFCWFYDHGPGHKAFLREDGLVYRAGFATQGEAEAWAKEQGIMDDEG